MIKAIPDEVWAFDCEWVPDIPSGRLAYALPDAASDLDVLNTMWSEGGATPDNPQPFLRTLLCRVVSIAAVIRRAVRGGEPQLFLLTLPENPDDPEQDEAYLLRRFLSEGLAKCSPQLVGYNSRNADLRILAQRALVRGLSLRSFCERLDAKPWESLDVDLMDLVSGFGKSASASLSQVASLCGIPGKLDTKGEDVCGLWYGGRRREIVQYNSFDALTTYLLWLRLAHFAGRLTDAEHALEQARVRRLIEERQRKPDGAYLGRYLEAWRDLKARTGQLGDGVFGAQ